MVTDTLHGILNADGTMQVESNDRQLRILLKRSIIFEEGRQLEVLFSEYYVKEGFGWKKTLNSANYKSADEFLDAIRNAEDFALAVRDIDEQKKGERTGG
jgi:hypothetical protein